MTGHEDEMIPCFLLLTLAGCCLLYLSHRHQGWLTAPLAAMPARVGGAICCLLSLGFGLQSFSVLTTVCAWLSLVMLTFGVLPFVSLLIKSMRHESM